MSLYLLLMVSWISGDGIAEVGHIIQVVFTIHKDWAPPLGNLLKTEEATLAAPPPLDLATCNFQVWQGVQVFVLFKSQIFSHKCQHVLKFEKNGEKYKHRIIAMQ